MQNLSVNDAHDDEEAAEEDQDEAVVDGTGDAESDVVDLPINKKNKHHKISPSPAREKGNGLEKWAGNFLEESSEEESLESDGNNSGF